MKNKRSSIYKKRITTALQSGINYLIDHQLPNGEFVVYMSGDEKMEGWISPESSIFPTALIGNNLLPMRENPKVTKILNNATKFLVSQRGSGITWNHFTYSHRLRDICPQDVDDTSCVSKFLEDVGHDFPSTRNKKLISDNKRSDGLIYTWFAFRLKPNKNKYYWYLAFLELKKPFKSWAFWHRFECSRYDVDAVVNANVLYYLGEKQETKPIISFLIQIIKENKEVGCDKWYQNPFTVYYFISRNYASGIKNFDKIRPLIIERTLNRLQPNGRIGESSLDTALGLTTLLNLNCDNDELINKAIEYLLLEQNENGSWNRRIFYYGGPKKVTGFGSEELTTSFCLESLKIYCNKSLSE